MIVEISEKYYNHIASPQFLDTSSVVLTCRTRCVSMLHGYVQECYVRSVGTNNMSIERFLEAVTTTEETASNLSI